MRFYTNWGKTYGPYGKCRKGKSPDYSKFKSEYSKRHVRLDILKSQVQMTSKKYRGNNYVKLFREKGNFYESEPRVISENVMT